MTLLGLCGAGRLSAVALLVACSVAMLVGVVQHDSRAAFQRGPVLCR